MFQEKPTRADQVVPVSLPWEIVGGYVYAILARELRLVKIGRSERSAECRLNEIVPQSPAHLELHSETWHEDLIGAEKGLHTRLTHARVRGEWFKMDDPDVAEWLVEREALMRYYEQFTAEIYALARAESGERNDRIRAVVRQARSANRARRATARAS